MNIKRSILLRVRMAFLAMALIAVAVGAKLIYIQSAEGEKWTAMAEKISLKIMEIDATRGNIYSDNGSLLATSLPFYRVAFDPTITTSTFFREHIDSLCYLLSRFYGDQPANSYRQRIESARKNGRRYLVLNHRKINYQEKKLMETWPIFRRGRLGGGVIFEKREIRFFPFSNLARRTVGFINENQRGAGLEYSFDQQLAGRKGEAIFQKIAGNTWKPLYDGTEVRPVDGYDIVTTININIQDVAESALMDALYQHDADYGCAVVMEVQSGEIKAIANLSKNNRGGYAERYNYAVGDQGLTEPGSTFKLASMIALFEDSHLSLGDSIDTGKGSYVFYDRTIRDAKPGGFGTITVKEAFEKSSNIAVMKLVDQQFGLKPQRFLDYLKALSLTQPLGFQLAGEGVPYVKSLEDRSWSGITLPWMSIGYELKLTPLHTLTLYNAIANNGKMVQPILVTEVRRADEVISRYRSVELVSKLCSEKTLAKMKILLEGVVQNGTARNIRDADYKIAGKTGTAKKYKNGRITNNYYTSFVGYFPAESPRYSCIVVIDNPKGYQQYGSDVAAPVFKEIADKIYATDTDWHAPYPLAKQDGDGTFPVIRAGEREDLEQITNSLGLQVNVKTDRSWITSRARNDSIVWEENPVEKGEVPDVRGMTLRDALYLLDNAGLKVFYEGQGRVEEQNILPGQKAIPGSAIKLKLG